jgi:hypothetical protein
MVMPPAAWKPIRFNIVVIGVLVITVGLCFAVDVVARKVGVGVTQVAARRREVELLFTATFAAVEEVVVMKVVQKARAPASLVVLGAAF